MKRYVIGEYPDTPEGRLNKHIKATIAEFEREKIAERTTRARRQKVEAGHVVSHGRAPYGYRLAVVNGKQTLALHEPEAQIVRMIFGLYLNEGLSFYEISHRLTGMSVPTAGDTCSLIYRQSRHGKWRRSVVAHIVHNETYAGKWYYSKRHKVNGRSVETPREARVCVEVPAIIDRETWERAQKRARENSRYSKRNTIHDYLLQHHLTCGHCSAPMYARMEGRYAYYACSGQYDRDALRRCTLRGYFRADAVNAAVWGWIKSFLTNPDLLVEGLKAEQAEREQAVKPLKDRLDVIDDLLADNRRQLERALDLYLSSDFPKEMLTGRKEQLQATIDALEHERLGLVARVEAQILTDEQVRIVAGFVKDVTQGIEAADRDFEARRHLIRLLDVQATLAIEDGQKVVYARCMLGDDTLSIGSTDS